MPSRKRKRKILVKGYMRPDKTSYYVVIPKPVRELLSLTGGEYFLMKAKADDGKIELKLVDFEDYTTTIEDSSDEKVESKELSQSEVSKKQVEYEPESNEEDEE